MRSVLITGGTGSFGRAFVKRLLSLQPGIYLDGKRIPIKSQPGSVTLVDGDLVEARAVDVPERICIYSRGEHAQAAMRAEFKDDPRLRFFIGDVRDKDRLQRAMQGVDVVVHAAALKRIEVGQYNPSEMVATNISGALNVIDAAHHARVAKVVALSSDKAYQPVSPYGQSKALAESLFLSANTEWGGPQFSVTRYGNVSGSAGSVIPRWRSLLEDGAVIPITDPGCTRFWMTMNEAVDLVLRAIQEMPSEVLIPTLPAYRLGDLALAMGVGSNNRIIGLPAWEKKHESMSEGNCSNTARRMSVAELREALKGV